MSQVTENKDYVLTEQERAAVQAINQAVLMGQSRVYNANVALEAAQAAARDAVAALHDAEQQFRGALNLLATAHGMDGARISPDMTRLIKSQ